MVPVSSTERFLTIETLDELATFLNISLKVLSFFAYSHKNFYTTFYIVKKNGKDKRKIDAPKGQLQNIQKNLASAFYELQGPLTSTYGFVKNRSIADNALQHVNKRSLVKMDLENFFPTISSGRVRGLFLSKPFCFNKLIANTLTNLVCHNGCLPQGAPTSPVLSNMICYRMDKTLLKFARSNGMKYTRYADDLTFSSTKKSALYKIICTDKNNRQVISQEMQEIVVNNGFKINKKKTGMFGRGTRQIVTGVVVNKKCNFKRDDYRYIRSLLYFWSKNDEESAARYYVKHESRRKYRSRLFKKDGSYIEHSLPKHIRGLLDYYSMITASNKRASEPLQKLWTRFYDITGQKVPEMIPGRSIFSLSVSYDFTDYNNPKKPIDKTGCGDGTAFLLKGVGLLTANHCIEELSLTAKEYRQYSLCFRQFESIGELSEKPNFKTGKIDSNDWAYIDTPLFFPDVPSLSFANEYSLQRGEKVVGFGFTDDTHRLRRIEAIVKEHIDNEIVVDRAFIKGMSGGPVLNARGKVVGLITQGSGNNYYDRDGRFLLLNSIPRVRELLESDSFE